MNRSEQLIQLVGRDLELDCADYQNLQELMQAQYEALLVRNSVQIESLNQQISVLLELIRARAQRRSKILTIFGLPADQPGAMVRLLSHASTTSRELFMQCWNALGRLVQNTRSLNERNGKLLAMHNEILSQLLANEESSQVYAPRY